MQMNPTWGDFKKYLRRNFDPEVVAVGRLIRSIPRQRKAAGTYTSLMAECDQIFIDRLPCEPLLHGTRTRRLPWPAYCRGQDPVRPDERNAPGPVPV